MIPAPGEEPGKRLSNREAWRIELFAFPWRNLPPSLATVATIASSFGVILLLAIAGAIRALRSDTPRPADRPMVSFAFAVVLAAYGLQTVLWALRGRVPIFPVNFEEIRAINMIMLPAVYFVARLYEFGPRAGRISQQVFRIAVVAAFALQPILVVRALPGPWREGILQAALDRGIVKRSDAPRVLYARQFLGLAGDGRRFYYSSRPVLQWLERNALPKDKVLTNLNDLHGARVEVIGPFLGIVHMDVWDPKRGDWARTLEAIDRALASRDTGKVLSLGRRVGATYAIVDWPVEGAVYRDEHYSVVRVQRRGPAQ
jgi:hypothetical protein